jgi:hypothetical protein
MKMIKKYSIAMISSLKNSDASLLQKITLSIPKVIKKVDNFVITSNGVYNLWCSKLQDL